MDNTVWIFGSIIIWERNKDRYLAKSAIVPSMALLSLLSTGIWSFCFLKKKKPPQLFSILAGTIMSRCLLLLDQFGRRFILRVGYSVPSAPSG